MKYGITALLVLVNAYFLKAQINPPSGSKLNYTQVMFEYKQIKNADQYIVEVAVDDNTGSFKKELIQQTDNSTATIISNLKFGNKYIWRYAGIVAGTQTSWSEPYKFETLIDTTIKLDKLHMRILKNDTTQNSKGLITIGCAKVIIDRNGNPVWYLPKLNNSIFIKRAGIHDIRVSDAGTLLFLSNNEKRSSAYECNLNGSVLWQAPNNGKVSQDSSEYYNHELRRLKNHNYMLIGAKYTWRLVPQEVNLARYNIENVDTTGKGRKVRILFNTIIEYDNKKDVVWSWNSANYLSDKDLFAPMSSTNNPRRDMPARAEIFGHMNAFDIDTAGEFIYAGFRDISRIIKIQKSTGKVINSWGLKMPSGDAVDGNDFFRNQHDLNLLPNGNICVFDNNDMWNKNISSRAVEFSQPKNKPSEIKWTFDCKIDSTY